ncbi:hypothetical protein SAMN04487761_10866 [Lachnospiraceae bacterium C7]|nr:hypothetical protein SAMN04487761_10866 [Lachnospiraceae bacterium C7]
MDMSKFIVNWNGAYAVNTGEQFNKFFVYLADDFKEALSEECENKGMHLKNFILGSQFICGFLKRGKRYVYFSWNFLNKDNRVNTKAEVMYREVENDHDFVNGIYETCPLEDLVKNVEKYFETHTLVA